MWLRVPALCGNFIKQRWSRVILASIYRSGIWRWELLHPSLPLRPLWYCLKTTSSKHEGKFCGFHAPFCVLCQWATIFYLIFKYLIFKVQKLLTLIIISIRTSHKSEEKTHGPDQNVSCIFIAFAKSQGLVYKHVIISSKFTLPAYWRNTKVVTNS